MILRIQIHHLAVGDLYTIREPSGSDVDEEFRHLGVKIWHQYKHSEDDTVDIHKVSQVRKSITWI